MSAEATAELEEARMRVLESLPCVFCSVACKDHTLEDLRDHIDQFDRMSKSGG